MMDNRSNAELDAHVLVLDEALEHEGEPPPKFSHDGLALRFATTYRDNIRYVELWNQWLIWDGVRWERDELRQVFTWARNVCRKASAEADAYNTKLSLTSAKTRAAVELFARDDPRLATRADHWDADPWLLNTPGGVIDLRTGDRHGHNPEFYMTKVTAVEPGSDCPLWLAFLDRVMDGDGEIISFLQRMCGYCLTGVTIEQAMCFLHGHGANGKSVFLNAVSGILNDYACNAPIEVFTESKGDRHPTEIARLHGARLVTAVETIEGRRWAEAKVKALTGGDTITARFMRRDDFEYVPQFKLLVSGNHKPHLRSVDEAIKRRFNLVSFTVTIPEQERDPDLSDKLKEEWPGILQWMIVGCIQWQEEGLNAPDSVKAATVAYLATQDSVSGWIDECLVKDPDGFEKATDLFKSWKAWATEAGEDVGKKADLYEVLERYCFQFERRTHGRGYMGYRIKAPERDSTAYPYID